MNYRPIFLRRCGVDIDTGIGIREGYVYTGMYLPGIFGWGRIPSELELGNVSKALKLRCQILMLTATMLLSAVIHVDVGIFGLK